MLKKRWKFIPAPTHEQIFHLKTAINASEALAAILVRRGLSDFNAVKEFFNPKLSQLHDPFLMKDMEKAVERITAAINNGERILVYGDYDVDGTTSVALMYSFLSEHYEQVSYYLPDRYAEGYGVSYKGIDFADDNDISLIIALDCGIKAVEKVKYAIERNIDFIICDHHLPGEQVPEAAAVLNPLQSDCNYPFKYLSGCGIGFKLVQALCTAWEIEKEFAYQYLDFVAIAAGCDIVSMTGENRVLTAFGIKLMHQSLRPGLRILFESGGLIQEGTYQFKRDLTVTDLVFTIGPRINAAGRMAHGELAVKLLTAKTTKQAEEPASLVNSNNDERRSVDKEIVEEALEMIDNSAEMQDQKSTVLFANHWHKGVVGIVASRLQDHYHRPTIVLTESNGKASGSARSVNGFDVHEAIEECADLLENFGGHPAAAGITLGLEKLESFKLRFEEAVSKKILPEQLIPTLEIDLRIDFHQITEKFFDQLNRMAPFGPDNMRPHFATYHVVDTGKTKQVGDGTHLRLEVHQPHISNTVMTGIAFKQGHHYERIASGEPFHLAYKLEWNEFRGEKNLQMMVEDIHFSEDEI